MIENDFSVLVLYCITDHKLIYHQKDARATLYGKFFARNKL